MAKAKSTKTPRPTKAKSKSAQPKPAGRGLSVADSIPRSALIATASAASIAADVGVRFTSGVGQLTAVLFRRGLLINMQSISQSGNIHFADVQAGDSMSVNGVCTGDADVTVSVATNPATPEHFTAGIILTGYTIL